VESSLACGVGAADHEHLAASVEGSLGDRSPVVDAAPDELLHTRYVEPPVVKR
jgi:hypothetical protein